MSKFRNSALFSIILLCFFIMKSNASHADTSRLESKLILKTDLAQIGWKVAQKHKLIPSFSCEYNFYKHKNSIMVSLYFYVFNSSISENSRNTQMYISEYRHYFNFSKNKAYTGIYLKYNKHQETFLYSASLTNSSSIREIAQVTEKVFGLGPFVGYQWNITKRLLADMLIGTGYRYRVYEEIEINKMTQNDTNYFGRRGQVDLRMALNLGFIIF